MQTQSQYSSSADSWENSKTFHTPKRRSERTSVSSTAMFKSRRNSASLGVKSILTDTPKRSFNASFINRRLYSDIIGSWHCITRSSHTLRRYRLTLRHALLLPIILSLGDLITDD